MNHDKESNVTHEFIAPDIIMIRAAEDIEEG